MEDDVTMGGSSSNRGDRNSRGSSRARGSRARGGTTRGGARGTVVQRRGVKTGSPSGLFSSITGRGRGIHKPLRARGGLSGKRDRADNDGDLQMGAQEEDPRKWRKNKDSFSGNPSSTIMISGHDVNEPKENVIQHLLNQVQAPITVVRSTSEGRKILVETENSQQAFALTRMNRVRYNGQQLFIKYAESTGTQNAGKAAHKSTLVPLLKTFLDTRYNTESHFLDLSRLGGTEVNGIAFDFNREGFMKGLFVAISDKYANVVSINFQENQITTLAPFSHLVRFPISSLQNISFENNMIAHFEELDHLKGIKLRELVFRGNPIATQNVDTKYQNEIAKRFDAVQFLDGQKIEPLVSFGLPTYVTNTALPALKGNLYDTPSTQTLVENFLKLYFHHYDNNRDGLLDVYSENSLFSMSTTLITKYLTDKNNPRRLPPDVVNFYKSHGRNLLHIPPESDRRVSLLQKGRLKIANMISHLLPATKHMFEDLRIDAFILNNIGSQLLTINVHGHYTETASDLKRSYDRAFLLMPAPADSAAALKGWPAVILNEQYHIRPYTALPRIDNQTAAANPSVPVPTVATPSLNKAEVLTKLTFVTKLTDEFAMQVLEQCQWNYDQALSTFYTAQNQGQIQQHMLRQ